MAIDVTATVTIAKPRDTVAAYVSDPANDLTWIRALSESKQLGGSAFGVGTRVERVAKMMGRPMRYTTEVRGFEPGRSVSMETISGPFLMKVDYLFEDSPGGTTVSVRNRGGSGLMFTIAGPLIARMVNSRVQGDLKALKKAIE